MFTVSLRGRSPWQSPPDDGDSHDQSADWSRNDKYLQAFSAVALPSAIWMRIDNCRTVHELPAGWCSAQRIININDCRWQSYIHYYSASINRNLFSLEYPIFGERSRKNRRVITLRLLFAIYCASILSNNSIYRAAGLSQLKSWDIQTFCSFLKAARFSRNKVKHRFREA